MSRSLEQRVYAYDRPGAKLLFALGMLLWPAAVGAAAPAASSSAADGSALASQLGEYGRQIHAVFQLPASASHSESLNSLGEVLSPDATVASPPMPPASARLPLRGRQTGLLDLAQGLRAPWANLGDDLASVDKHLNGRGLLGARGRIVARRAPAAADVSTDDTNVPEEVTAPRSRGDPEARSDERPDVVGRPIANPSGIEELPGCPSVLAGTVSVDAEETWGLGLGASLVSRHQSVRSNSPDDRKRGLTTTDTVHTLSVGLGVKTQLQATFNTHSEDWQDSLGKPDQNRHRSAIEFTSQFGGDGRHGLRLAMASDEHKVGDRMRAQRTREAHLNLAPTRRLKLNADYLVRKTGDSGGQKTGTLGGVIQLAQNAELAAAWKTVAADSRGRSKESSLKLSTGLGAGDSTANLTAERTMIRTESLGPVAKLNCSFTGTLGRGDKQADLTARLNEQRGEGASGLLARSAALSLERQLGSHLKLAAFHDETSRGTNENYTTTLDSECRLEAEAGRNTTLAVAVGRRMTPRDPLRRVRELSVEHRIGQILLHAQHQFWLESSGAGTISGAAVDLPIGDLPAWAKGICEQREFRDAREYLAPQEVKWEDIRFAGFRIAAKQRRGGIDDGLNTLTVVHRGIIRKRYHLRLLYQQCPEVERGLDQGRPMMARRQLGELGLPVRQKLVAFGRVTRELSTFDPDSRWLTTTLGLQGSLSDAEQLETSVWRERGRWDTEASDRTTVMLLYSRQVDEEHHLSFKLGYSWGESDTHQDLREYRFTLGYKNPI